MRAKVTAIAFTVSLFFPVLAQSQDAPTGTRINSSRAANSLTVINMRQAGTIDEIEQLLEQRQTDKAYKLASRYANEVDKAGLDASTRYFAHNAMCVVYTQMREYQKAMDECDLAIEIMGAHWSVWNNRGTLFFLAEEFESAKSDYENALRRSGSKGNQAEMIRHNLQLVNLNIRARSS